MSLILASLLHSLCDDFADLGHDVGVRGRAQLAVHTKPVSLRRVVTNLIDNAIKYGLCARVEYRKSAEPVEIIVEDDGPNIPSHLQEEAFRPFRRLGPDCLEVEGSGLALTIARSIARALGGDVLLANSGGAGLRATVVLPKRSRKAPGRPIVAEETRFEPRAPG